jgi:uncharacterized membrane protein
VGRDGNVFRYRCGEGRKSYGNGPGVAGALIATVVGLFVAIPAMFAYNYMITTVRAITQELDNFTTEYATAVSIFTWITARWQKKSRMHCDKWDSVVASGLRLLLLRLIPMPESRYELAPV